MSHSQNRIDRRVQLLSQAITHRQQLLAGFLAPRGSVPALHEQLSSRDALSFWRQHRYDALGQQIMQNYTPEDIAQLDNALAKQNEIDGLGEPDPQMTQMGTDSGRSLGGIYGNT